MIKKKNYNKGEWAEFYTFLRILGDAKVTAADRTLRPLLQKYFIFEQVFRVSEENKELTYNLQASEIVNIFETKCPNTSLGTIPKKQITKEAAHILKALLGKADPATSPSLDKLRSDLLDPHFKASSTSKADIVGTIKDRLGNLSERIGFSVKSYIGGAPTLLNASQATNFIFSVIGLKPKDIDTVNSICTKNKIQDRVKKIFELGGNLQFIHVENPTFEANLKKIDTMMPEFIAQMLIDFSYSSARSIAQLVELLAENSKLFKNYGLTLKDYEYKIKNLLQAAALGMVPKKEWNGLDSAYGGYLVVKEEGNLVCYNLHYRDEFLGYLFDNTKFEASSTSRHKYAEIYCDEKNKDMFFKLNLQIRFKDSKKES